MKKNWNSLTEVKNYIETKTSEKIESFNGWKLMTDKNIYTLAFGILNVKER